MVMTRRQLQQIRNTLLLLDTALATLDPHAEVLVGETASDPAAFVSWGYLRELLAQAVAQIRPPKPGRVPRIRRRSE